VGCREEYWDLKNEENEIFCIMKSLIISDVHVVIKQVECDG
jgi:hypothetical protein